jgi:hypothetical protein
VKVVASKRDASESILDEGHRSPRVKVGSRNSDGIAPGLSIIPGDYINDRLMMIYQHLI